MPKKLLITLLLILSVHCPLMVALSEVSEDGRILVWALGVWRVDKIREKGPRFLVESYPKGTVYRERLERRLSSEELLHEFMSFSDDDIRDICEFRAHLLAKDKKSDPINACPHFYPPMDHIRRQATVKIDPKHSELGRNLLLALYEKIWPFESGGTGPERGPGGKFEPVVQSRSGPD